MNIGGNYYIPTFFYESLWCLLGFVVLMVLRYALKKCNEGFLTSVYLIWYGIGRLYIESLRTDSLMLGNIKIAQLVSMLSILIGIVLLITSILKIYSEFKNDNKMVEIEKGRKAKTPKSK